MVRSGGGEGAASRRGTGGRPTRQDAQKRDQRLIREATRLFMERGFEGTSIEAVAEAAGVGKVTVYNRYRDKRELFVAVLRERIRNWLAPLSLAAEAKADSDAQEDVTTTLERLSLDLLKHAQAPGADSLQRILAAQALEFPELAKLALEEGWMRAIRAVATILARLEQRGQIAVDDVDLAAEFFLNLVIGAKTRLAIYGLAPSHAELERRRAAAVELFVRAIRRK